MNPNAKQNELSPSQYDLLRELCQIIIPADEFSGGAIEAGVPEFISLLASEDENYFRIVSGGLLWLDATCRRCFGDNFVSCTPVDRSHILSLIAYRNAQTEELHLRAAREFFSLLRKGTVDGFFTSAIGIKDLQYIGNSQVQAFEGCQFIEAKNVPLNGGQRDRVSNLSAENHSSTEAAR